MTGVQTCALPIWSHQGKELPAPDLQVELLQDMDLLGPAPEHAVHAVDVDQHFVVIAHGLSKGWHAATQRTQRSEEVARTEWPQKGEEGARKGVLNSEPKLPTLGLGYFLRILRLLAANGFGGWISAFSASLRATGLKGIRAVR